MKSIVLQTRNGSFNAYMGRQGEISLNEQTGELRFHDGVTPGGRPVIATMKNDLMRLVADAVVPNSFLGSPEGVATLDGQGKIIAEQMPNLEAIFDICMENSEFDGGYF